MELRTILAVLADDERARRVVLDRFRELGGKLDRFDGVRADRMRMLDALVHAEDVVELDTAGRLRAHDAPDRVALRRVRRALETELAL